MSTSHNRNVKPGSSKGVLKKRIAPPASSTPKATGVSKAVSDSEANDDLLQYHAGIKDQTGKVIEFTSENDICPICKTDRYSKPSLRLLISSCYHKACETCIDRLFSVSAQKCPAPGCQRILRKVNFVHQTFEDLQVEREVVIRRKLASIFNKTSDDFASETEHDNYLEVVEDYAFNLINNVNITETNQKIAAYQLENVGSIAEKAARQANERMKLLEQEEMSNRERNTSARKALEEETEKERQLNELKQQAFDSIARGENGQVYYRRMEQLRQSSTSSTNDDRRRKRATRLDVSSQSQHLPVSPAYLGPYVPIPFALNTLPSTHPGILLSTTDVGPGADNAKYGYNDVDYIDQQLKIHENLVRVQAGGFNLEQLWHRDLNLALEELFIPCIP